MSSNCRALTDVCTEKKAANMRVQRVALTLIAITQISYGALFVAAPNSVAGLLGLQAGAPGWVDWLLVTAGARFIGYGIGLFAAARSPERHRLWINTMIAIQAVDFIANVAYMANGALPFDRVAPTVWLPLVWMALLGWASRAGRVMAPKAGNVGTPTIVGD
jgi:hypothetical protein